MRQDAFPLPGMSLAFKSGAPEHCCYPPTVPGRPPVPHIWGNSVNLSRVCTGLFHGPERRPPPSSASSPVRVCPWRGSCGRQTGRTGLHSLGFPAPPSHEALPCSERLRGVSHPGEGSPMPRMSRWNRLSSKSHGICVSPGSAS